MSSMAAIKTQTASMCFQSKLESRVDSSRQTDEGWAEPLVKWLREKAHVQEVMGSSLSTRWKEGDG